jgi:putative ATPase
MKKLSLPQVPLAERIRPENFEEFVGQEHLLSKGKPLYTMIISNNLSSFILWGPPGSGKTTIARIIAKQTDSDFHNLNAVSSGVKEVRQIIDIAQRNKILNRRTILFIDEIHRFNKAQQDSLLNPIETGLIILIGATTENPSFELIPALRSRTRIFVLNRLSFDELKKIISLALIKDEFLKSLNIKTIDEEFLINLCSGDARVVLNILEAAILQEINSSEIKLTKEVFENVVQKKNIIYDKSGEEHYNLISAFIKSVRGSDPDAAIYWLARMLEAGEDPLFIARRLIILAAEDIGNASPNALVLAESTFSAVEKVGMPESRIILAQCTTYLASSPKSNSSYLAIEEALNEVKNGQQYPVPIHLRNAPTDFMKKLGYGEQYKYSHKFENHFVEQDFLPNELIDKQFYFPTEQGQEKKLKEYLKNLWKNKKNYK